MAYQRRAPANGKPKLPPLLEAELMVTAAKMNMTGTEANVDAVQRWIKWANVTEPRERYKAAVRDFEAGRGPSPMAQDYGLPADIGIPRHP